MINKFFKNAVSLFFGSRKGKGVEKPKIVERKEQKPIEDTRHVIEARNRAKEIVLDAKNEALEIKRKAETEFRNVREESFNVEKKLEASKATLEQKEKDLREKEDNAKKLRDTYLSKLDEIENIKKKQVEKLEKAAGFTRNEAKKIIIEHTEKLMEKDISQRIREAKEKIEARSKEEAKQILIEAMHQASTDYVSEYTISKVKLSDEDIKGRIIGKDGRNIRSFEEVTGVNLDMDETPNEVRISCFDSVRREIARVSLERLIADGRIQPARIEEVVKNVRSEIEKVMYKAGEDLAHKVGVYNLPREVIALLGRFKYRFSYGQNMLEHTLEEVKIGTFIAKEIGADTNLTKLACLLHDIGKAVSEEEEGTHIDLGVKILKKHNLPKEVINAVAEHHSDKFSSVESIIVQIADSISGSRPGARYVGFDDYVERMKALEDTAKSLSGVANAFAISAGRELRVIVEPKEITDDLVDKLAFDIAKSLEKDHTYPGTIKVTVIRDYRAVEIAK